MTSQQKPTADRPADHPDGSRRQDAEKPKPTMEVRVPPELAAKRERAAKEEELERMKREAKEAQERYLRTLAEFENTKKRLHREKEEFVRYASETMVRELLPIVDSLDQALVAIDPSTPPHPGAGCGVARDSAPRGTGESVTGAPAGLRKPSDIEAIIKGVHLIYRQLLGLLEKEGVKRIQTVGEPFDPHRHEAVAQVDAADGTPDETVVEEVQVGYTMHGKVIRPAMVKVAKKAAPPATGHGGSATSGGGSTQSTTDQSSEEESRWQK